MSKQGKEVIDYVTPFSFELEGEPFVPGQSAFYSSEIEIPKNSCLNYSAILWVSADVDFDFMHLINYQAAK